MQVNLLQYLFDAYDYDFSEMSVPSRLDWKKGLVGRDGPGPAEYFPREYELIKDTAEYLIDNGIRRDTNLNLRTERVVPGWPPRTTETGIGPREETIVSWVKPFP